MRLKFLTDSRERTRFFRFAIVGAIGTVVDFGTFNLLSSILGIDHVISSIFSFATAVLSNFTWNRYWTYPDSRSKPLSKQLIEFSVVNLVGLGIRTPLFAGLSIPLVRLFVLLPFLQSDLITPELLGHNFALAIAILVVMLWNYFVNRHWTYNDVE